MFDIDRSLSRMMNNKMDFRIPSFRMPSIDRFSRDSVTVRSNQEKTYELAIKHNKTRCDFCSEILTPNNIFGLAETTNGKIIASCNKPRCKGIMWGSASEETKKNYIDVRKPEEVLVEKQRNLNGADMLKVYCDAAKQNRMSIKIQYVGENGPINGLSVFVYPDYNLLRNIMDHPDQNLRSEIFKRYRIDSRPLLIPGEFSALNNIRSKNDFNNAIRRQL